MKKLIFFALIMLSFNCFAQRGKTVQLMGTVTIEGNESAFIKSDQMAQSNGFIGIQIVVTDTTSITSGTGYAIAKASLFDFDNAYEFSTLETIQNSVYTSQNDTMTITQPDSYLWGISCLPFDYVGAYIQGAVGDTFTVKVYYVGKEY